jgi:hypothetical protein
MLAAEMSFDVFIKYQSHHSIATNAIFVGDAQRKHDNHEDANGAGGRDSHVNDTSLLQEDDMEWQWCRVLVRLM